MPDRPTERDCDPHLGMADASQLSVCLMAHESSTQQVDAKLRAEAALDSTHEVARAAPPHLTGVVKWIASSSQVFSRSSHQKKDGSKETGCSRPIDLRPSRAWGHVRSHRWSRWQRKNASSYRSRSSRMARKRGKWTMTVKMKSRRNRKRTKRIVKNTRNTRRMTSIKRDTNETKTKTAVMNPTMKMSSRARRRTPKIKTRKSMTARRKGTEVKANQNPAATQRPTKKRRIKRERNGIGQTLKNQKAESAGRVRKRTNITILIPGTSEITLTVEGNLNLPIR